MGVGVGGFCGGGGVLGWLGVNQAEAEYWKRWVWMVRGGGLFAGEGRGGEKGIRVDIGEGGLEGECLMDVLLVLDPWMKEWVARVNQAEAEYKKRCVWREGRAVWGGGEGA